MEIQRKTTALVWPTPVHVECPQGRRLVQELWEDPPAHPAPQHPRSRLAKPQRPQGVQQAAVETEVGCHALGLGSEKAAGGQAKRPWESGVGEREKRNQKLAPPGPVAAQPRVKLNNRI